MPLDPVALNDPHVAAHNAERNMLNTIQDALTDFLPAPTDGAASSTTFLRGDGVWAVPAGGGGGGGAVRGDGMPLVT